MVNQIEYHPGQMQEDVVNFCRNHDIVVEGWSPLGTGRMLQKMKKQLFQEQLVTVRQALCPG